MKESGLGFFAEHFDAQSIIQPLKGILKISQKGNE
jgi:hypothetical protein